jgi:hypothetical protein
MAQKQCERGHFYDPAQYNQCPHCPIKGLDIGDPGPKVIRQQANAPAMAPAAAPAAGPPAAAPPLPRSKTIAIWPGQPNAPGKVRRLDPVVGWLVAVAGPALGRDFRIHWGNNSIGRDPDEPICLAEDESVSGKGHAFVIYDTRNNNFLLKAGSGNVRGLVHIGNEENGPLKLVVEAVELEPYLPIHIGNSKLIFVPLCSDMFTWQLSGGAGGAASGRS